MEGGNLNLLLAAAVASAHTDDDDNSDSNDEREREPLTVYDALDLWVGHKSRNGMATTDFLCFNMWCVLFK